MLTLTTIRRLSVLLFVFLVWTPAAYAWSWPVAGPVLRPFSYDEAHPYASGQHRGVDIGADAEGEAVVAPAAGTVSFAGTVPTNGKTITIETADGYSVTLTHLGSIAVGKGATVAEQDAVGAIGPSGTPEVDEPYVHLGIRLTADPNGYVDPLGLLPPAPDPAATDTSTTASQPASTGAASAAPAAKPARSAPRSAHTATTRRAHPESERSHVRTHQQERAQKSRPNARTSQSPHRVAVRDRASEPTRSSRRPVAESVAPRPIRLHAGHDIRPTLSVTQSRREPTNWLPSLICNGAAAVFALALVLAASRRRLDASPISGAEILRLPSSAEELRHISRAA